MKELEYPFDSNLILRKKKSIKKTLLSSNTNFIEKKIAILGGSTTKNIVECLELFLLNNGIKPTFYESEYNKFYEDAIFSNDELNNFKPDIVYIMTSFRNIINTPNISDSTTIINNKIEDEYNKYTQIWETLKKNFNPFIIQNNFEMPNYRLLGNRDCSLKQGFINFINTLNNKFYDYANSNDNFFILDLNYISADFGLNNWHDEEIYALYKYAMNLQAIPYVSFNVSNIIKSHLGKNKKAIVLDLDNTLWGGIVGDDGVENIKVGPVGAIDEMYLSFQKYIKKQKDLGIILNISSKNEEDIAIKAIEESDGVLKKDDFINMKINWNPKDINIMNIAKEINLGADSFVFIDDNPAEREIVSHNILGISTPEISTVSNYIKIIDKSGFFENTVISKEDLEKTKMYKENFLRNQELTKFENYGDYLDALDMTAIIKPFDFKFISRISQLSNKSNQFNLTTKRYEETDVENIINDKNYLTLYGKLNDKFGDNGIVSLIIGKIDDTSPNILHINLWLMSCRVLKREMEYAMMDELIKLCISHNITKIYGYYYKTQKNKMVSNFYDDMQFTLIENNNDDEKIYEYNIETNYKNRNSHIKIEK